MITRDGITTCRGMNVSLDVSSCSTKEANFNLNLPTTTDTLVSLKRMEVRSHIFYLENHCLQNKTVTRSRSLSSLIFGPGRKSKDRSQASVFHALVVIFLEYFAWGLLTVPVINVSAPLFIRKSSYSFTGLSRDLSHE